MIGLKWTILGIFMLCVAGGVLNLSQLVESFCLGSGVTCVAIGTWIQE